jgi:hypothetical protein
MATRGCSSIRLSWIALELLRLRPHIMTTPQSTGQELWSEGSWMGSSREWRWADCDVREERYGRERENAVLARRRRMSSSIFRAIGEQFFLGEWKLSTHDTDYGKMKISYPNKVTSFWPPSTGCMRHPLLFSFDDPQGRFCLRPRLNS